MRARKATSSILAVLVVGIVLVAGNAPAVEPGVDAVNLERAQVPNARIALKNATHLEFLRRPIDGAVHTFALIGARDYADTSGGWTRPGAGLNIIDLTDPADPASPVPSPRFIQNVPCITDNLDSAVVNVDVTESIVDRDGVVRDVAYDQLIAVSSNDTTGCPTVKDANGNVIKTPAGTNVRGGSVAFIGIRKDPLPGEVLTADWLGTVKSATGKFRTWTKMAHTVVPHPTRPVVYISSQTLPDRPTRVEILDMSVWPPTVIEHAVTNSMVAPHDITFSPDGNRAFVSSINASFIWDTSGDKLLAPTLVGPLVAPGLKVHHEANLHPNGRHLLVVDEFVATSSNGQVTATPVCPGGGVHVFDLGEDAALEAAPVQVGAFFADDTSFTGMAAAQEVPGAEDPAEQAQKVAEIGCTAHEFTMSPDGRWTPMAWFGAGVRLFDLTSLQDAAALPAPSPVTVSEFGHFKTPTSNVWAAKVRPEFPNYIFVSDENTGFEVLRVTGGLP